jgi:HNH endonuclease
MSMFSQDAVGTLFHMKIISTGWKEVIQERFEEKFIPEPNSGCWIWTASINRLGYGTVAHKGKIWKAHRVSWDLYTGVIPEGMSVLHKCDNRLCVNPDHLFLGDQTDNMRDMVAKGRGKTPSLRGEKNPMSKLTAASVSEIRLRVKSGATQKSLCPVYGVAPMTISRVVRGETWKEGTNHVSRDN